MELINKGSGLYDVVVNGEKVGQVWERSHDFTWHGSVLNGRSLRAPAGFLSKEGAAEAVAEAAQS